MRVETEDIQRHYMKEEADMMLDSLCPVYSILGCSFHLCPTNALEHPAPTSTNSDEHFNV